MPFIADFHIHSKYSRATAKDMDLAALVKWAKIKGVSMLGTGDFTHPLWFSELKSKLCESGSPGVYKYEEIDFILTVEVSNIYFKAGRTRKVHNIIFAPSLEAAAEISSALSEYGELSSDGRPALSVECDRMVRLLTRIDPGIFFIPAHAWTPHFSVFGSNSGFDSPEECFEDQAEKIFSLETGLSSDPGMNRRWSKLDRFCLTSNSDAHSPSKIAREANVFKERIDYNGLRDILQNKDKARFLYTIEFFPEEGKYHWDGHRNCKARLSPREAANINNICPVCGKKVTIGVMHRLEGLADRPEGYVDSAGPAFKKVVPLAEVIASALGVGPESVKVEREYFQLIKNFGTEFRVLLEMDEPELIAALPERIARGIINVRSGNVEIAPGYDGEYGKVKIFKEGDESQDKQLSFF
ncbi:MAG: endonuclease Q family protein [Candidatus Omnitrophota bacterium]|nr:endonuclease Q family protein [Candidatus Omnitrophota bacterium]